MRSGLIIFLLMVLFTACDTPQQKELYDLAAGAKLFELNCANCHQKDGSGLALLMPPINRPEWYAKNYTSLPGLIRYGRSAGAVINGRTYKLPMPANSRLTDAEVIRIARFVAQKFGGLSELPADSIWFRSLQSASRN